MKKISFLLVFSFILLGFSTTYAQGDEQKKHKRGKNSAVKKEMKEYMKKNVLPVLREQRAKLEKDISATDKTQINTFRTELKKNHALVKAGKKKKKEAKKAGNEIPQAEKEAIWIAKGRNKEIIGQARELSKTYKDKIQVLLDEISDKQNQWESDMKAIHEKNHKDKAENDKNKHKRGGDRAHKMKRARPVHFLLLDPNGTDDELDDMFDDGEE